MDRQRRRFAANASRHDRHGAEFAHGAGGAQDDAADERPLDVRQRHAPEHLPAVRAEEARRFLLLAPDASITAMSSRATNGNDTKIVASTMPGTAKMILMSRSKQPRSEPALPAEQLHEDQPGDDRRHGERQIDQRREQALAAEVEPGDRPRGGDAEDRVGRHGQRGDDERQPDRRERLRRLDRRHVRLPSVAERLDEDEDERNEEKDERERPARASSARRGRRSGSVNPGSLPGSHLETASAANVPAVVAVKAEQKSGGQENYCFQWIS